MNLYTKSFTPSYNQPCIPFNKYEQLRDKQGLVRELELILFPNTAVITIDKLDEAQSLQAVRTENYDQVLYVDLRLLTQKSSNNKKRKGPNKYQMLEWLRNCEGIRYLWGGNYKEGLASTMKSLYPNAFEEPLDPEAFSDLCCCGLDCSGLLYQASEGFTPRNTSQLLSFGTEIPIKNPFCVEELLDKIEPLDIIVSKGHVVIVLSKDHLIESCLTKGGVAITPLETRYLELRQTPEKFFIKRWLPIYEQKQNELPP